MIDILRHPTQEDWARCKLLALGTVGKDYHGDGSEITDEWKHRMLRAGHSPIRTLPFTIQMIVPYYVSTHFVRHKLGVEHYVSTQRNDRQSAYDRAHAPQSMLVMHIMDINAQALMNMAQMRLCGKADYVTRETMNAVCDAVTKTNPEFGPFLMPKCVVRGGCNEFEPCGLIKGV